MQLLVSNSEVQEYLQEQIEELATNISLSHFDDKIKWAEANFEYGRTACILAELEHGTASYKLYEKAIEAFKNALPVYKGNEHFKKKCSTTIALCKTLRFYGLQKGGAYGEACLVQALNFLHKLSKSIKQEKLYKTLVNVICEEAYLYRALAQFSQRSKRLFYLEQTSQALAKATKILQQKEDFTDWAYILLIHAHVHVEISRMQNKDSARASLETAAGLFKAVLESAKHQTHAAMPMIKENEYVNAAFELGCTYTKLAYQSKSNNNLIDLINALSAFALITDTMIAQLDDKTKTELYQNKANLLSILAHKTPENKVALQILWQAIGLHEQSLASLHNQAWSATNINILYQLAKNLESCALRSVTTERNQHQLTAIASLRKAKQQAELKKETNLYSKSSWRLANLLYKTAILEVTDKTALSLLSEAVETYKKILKTKYLPSRLPVYKKLAAIYAYMAELQNSAALNDKYLKKSIAYLYKATKLAATDCSLKLKLAQNLIKLATLNKTSKKYRIAVEKALKAIANNADIKPIWLRKAKLLQAEFYYLCSKNNKLIKRVAYLSQSHTIYNENGLDPARAKAIAQELESLYKKHWLRLLFVKKANRVK